MTDYSYDNENEMGRGRLPKVVLELNKKKEWGNGSKETLSTDPKIGKKWQSFVILRYRLSSYDAMFSFRLSYLTASGSVL
jgi:hypothetical protein